MTVNGIRIHNVYYMLAYAFRALGEGVYARLEGEDFENIEDLFGAILALGLTHLLKRGLHREYEPIAADLSGLRGKVQISGTIRHRLANRRLLRCEYDDYSPNNLFNQILKSTSAALLRTGELSKSGNDLKRALRYLGDVDEIDVHQIRWGALRYQRSNQHYMTLIGVCRFVVEGLILGEEEADNGCRMRHVLVDEKRMASLYEAFVREYFSRHYDLNAAIRQIPWSVPAGIDAAALPVMQTDVMLHDSNRTLIIDTKFYGRIMQVHWDVQSLRSGHLYQICSYVSNWQALRPDHTVSGMLLYAKTTDGVPSPGAWPICGNHISVEVLDLGRPFGEISAQLDNIAHRYFPGGDIKRMK